MEILKIALTAIGTFVSVLALSFTVFSYWKKKQEDENNAFKASVKETIIAEKCTREKDYEKLEKRVDYLENNFMTSVQTRMGNIEGELKGMRPILQAIQNWFIQHTPKG